MIRFLFKKIIVFTKPFRYWLDRVTFRFRKKGEELLGLGGSLRGKPLLIVGNGPSLNKTPLDNFEGVYSIGMNKIDMIFKKTSWRPDIIVTTNNLVVHQHCRIMAENQIPCYLSWKSRWLVPRKLRNRFGFFLDKLTSEFESDISEGIGSSDTVTYVALQFAYYMEADPVIIVGVDHSFVQSGNANEYTKREGDDVNHFDPNYFASGKYWGVPNLQGSEVVYLKAKNAFDAAGRTILDATIDGKLKIFDKVSIDDAIIMTKKR